MNQFRSSGIPGLMPIVRNIIIINVLFFVATIAATFIGQGIDLADYLGLHYWGSDQFQPYQFITYMFMHGGFGHIFFNMFAVWMFGNALEQVWGPKRFLIYYFVTGIGAGILHLLVLWYQFHGLQETLNLFMTDPNPVDFEALVQNYFSGHYNPDWLSQMVQYWNANPNDPSMISEASRSLNVLMQSTMSVPTVGASGAVFGILLAYGMLFPNSEIYLYMIFPMKAKWFVILYGALELYLGVSNSGNDNIAHFAHLGGMIFGFILIKYWKNRQWR